MNVDEKMMRCHSSSFPGFDEFNVFHHESNVVLQGGLSTREMLSSHSTHRLEYMSAFLLNQLPPVYACFIYKVSLSSLFILAIFAETDRSMVRSPISTMSPPRISGLTLGTTLSFWPLAT